MQKQEKALKEDPFLGDANWYLVWRCGPVCIASGIPSYFFSGVALICDWFRLASVRCVGLVSCGCYLVLFFGRLVWFCRCFGLISFS